MTVLVHFSGPSYSKTAVLQPGAPAIDVGRDAQAAIHLPDTDRLISRRHVMLEWAEGGVRVSVLSKVNGITTPRGEVTLGQTVILMPGETAQLGRFSLMIEAGGAGAQPSAPFAPAPAADDPFQVFGGGVGAPAGSSVFDDPFFRAPARPAHASVLEVPAALDVMSGKPTVLGMPSSFTGAAPGGGSDDPLAAFGGNQVPVHSSVSIDEFLGAPTRQSSGLGAAHLLRPEAPESQRRLATDHVHDFNLPLRPRAAQSPFMPPAMPPMPAPAPLPMAFSDAADPLAALDALAAPAPPAAAAAAARPGGSAGDPWGDFAKDWVPASPARNERPPAVSPAASGPINHAFDDAFSSSTAWRVEDMPLPDALPNASFEENALIGAAFSIPGEPAGTGAPAPDQGAANAAALRSLCRGLGIPAPPQINDRDWEKLGKSIRQIVQGLGDLMDVRAELKKEMRAVDRTMLGAQENNPLKSGMPLEELLQYLLFMPQGAAGYMPVDRALDESISDLRAHEFASLAAVRSAVEGSIREFEPAKLRTTLLKGKRSIATAIDNARLWELYAAYYEQKGLHMADWLEQMFNRHFMPAYSRESERLRRESQLPADQPPRTF